MERMEIEMAMRRAVLTAEYLAEDRSYQLVGISIAFAVLTTIILSLRFYAKRFQGGGIYADDMFLCAAYVVNLGMCAVGISKWLALRTQPVSQDVSGVAYSSQGLRVKASLLILDNSHDKNRRRRSPRRVRRGGAPETAHRLGTVDPRLRAHLLHFGRPAEAGHYLPIPADFQLEGCDAQRGVGPLHPHGHDVRLARRGGLLPVHADRVLVGQDDPGGTLLRRAGLLPRAGSARLRARLGDHGVADADYLAP